MSISKNSYDIEKSKFEDDDQSCTISVIDTTEIIASVGINKEQEKILVRKLDWHILPLYCTFYFADYLDRANIGNAILAGLQQDTGMTSNQLSLVISAFFITYVVFELPSNMILKKTNAARWLSFTMLIWGLSTLVSGFLTNFAGFFVARLVLGAAESGYIPGMLYLLSQVYTPNELGLRIAILLTMATLSGIVSGPLAYAVSFLDGHLGLHDWQYLFIIEGSYTVALSLVSFFYLIGDINKVKWLTPEQKIIQMHRISETTGCSDEDSSNFSISIFIKALADLKTWGFASVVFLTSINITSIGVFCPTLIDGFGFTTLQAQLLTAPPAVFCTITVILGGYLINKYSYRSPLIVIGSLMSALGYLLLLVLENKWALYGAIFVITAGLGLGGSAAMSWSPINYPDLTVRAIGVAVVLMIGNTGSIVASYIFDSSSAPDYVFGLSINIAASIASALVASLMGYLFHRANSRVQKGYTKQIYHP